VQWFSTFLESEPFLECLTGPAKNFYLTKILSSGMLPLIWKKFINISEERTASIFWRSQHIPPKQWQTSSRVNGITSQKQSCHMIERDYRRGLD
jgi:hypothetical protein